jgi:serine/threonine protein phosphatase PrpC
VASHKAVEIIVDCIRSLKDQRPTGEDLTEWFDKANEEVLALQTEACQMKTTLALLCVDEQTCSALTAHLGDTRIYHFEDGKCVFYTFDHSVSRMSVLAGEIEMEDIRFHADRNKLLKAIGKAEDVKAEIDVLEMDEKKEHAFLLCTDGFWEYVTEEDMERTLAQAQSPEEWLAMMRDVLNQNEKKKENNDNNSAIAVWLTA